MTATDLARRLVEHPRWCWQPGMAVRPGDTVVAVEGHVVHITDGRSNASFLRMDGTPDIDHPATNGWLLHWLDESCVTLMLLRGGLIFVEWDDASGVRHRDAFDDVASALLAVWGEP